MPKHEQAAPWRWCKRVTYGGRAYEPGDEVPEMPRERVLRFERTGRIAHVTSERWVALQRALAATTK